MRSFLVSCCIVLLASVIGASAFSVSRMMAGTWVATRGDFTIYQGSLFTFVVIMGLVYFFSIFVVDSRFMIKLMEGYSKKTTSLVEAMRQFVFVFLVIITTNLSLKVISGTFDLNVMSIPEYLTTLVGVGFLLDRVFRRVAESGR